MPSKQAFSVETDSINPLLNRRHFVQLGALAGAALTARQVLSANGGGSQVMRVGVAKTVITPEQSLWMAGYASRDKPSEGKDHDLFAKALALEDAQGNRAVLVTTDLVGLPKELSDRIAERVEKNTGLSRAALILNSSHTHSGPIVQVKVYYKLPEEQVTAITEYIQTLEDKLVAVAEAALKDLEPGKLEYGIGECGFAVNRREYTLNGIIIGVNPIGPVDHDVPVLRITKPDGSLKAVVFGYACHNTTLNFYNFNGDYAGYAQANLEEALPGCVAMFVAGCAGDQNPHPRRKLELAQQHGRSLSDSVLKALSNPMRPIGGDLRCAYQLTDLPFSPAPPREKIEAELASSDIYLQRRAKMLLETLDREGKLPETYPYPVQVWSIGEDFDWIGLAGEAVVDYSLRLKYELGPEKTWVCSYCNDVFAYIPSLRVLREGGYEGGQSMVYEGFHGPWAPQVEQVVLEAVHKAIDQNHS